MTSKVRGSDASWVDRTVQAHKLLRDWDEAESTKSIRIGVPPQTTNWEAEYGAINDTDAKEVPESSAFFQDSESLPRWKSWDLTNLTQKWLDGTETNHGVILWATNEDVDGYDIRFHQSETQQVSDQPYLEILWTEEIKTVYFLKDHLGSIRATVDDVGQVVGFDDYDPWGMILPNRSMATGLSNLDAAKNRFTSKAWDDEFGLDWNYFGARYYDPVIGRFLGVDPLLEKHPDFTPYHYVLNNPLLFVDPDGQQANIHTFLHRANVFERTGRLFTQDEVSSMVSTLKDSEFQTQIAIETLDAIIARAENLSATASIGALVTAPFPPAAAAMVKIAGVASLVDIGASTLRATLTLSTQDVVGTSVNLAFEISGEIGKVLLKRIPGGEFAGKLTSEQLTTLVALIEGTGGTLENISHEQLTSFIIQLLGETDANSDEEEQN